MHFCPSSSLEPIGISRPRLILSSVTCLVAVKRPISMSRYRIRVTDERESPIPIDHLLQQTPPRHNASGRDMGTLHLGVAYKYVGRHSSAAGIEPHRSVDLGTMHGMPLILRLPPHGVGRPRTTGQPRGTNTRWPEIFFDAAGQLLKTRSSSRRLIPVCLS